MWDSLDAWRRREAEDRGRPPGAGGRPPGGAPPRRGGAPGAPVGPLGPPAGRRGWDAPGDPDPRDEPWAGSGERAPLPRRGGGTPPGRTPTQHPRGWQDELTGRGPAARGPGAPVGPAGPGPGGRGERPRADTWYPQDRAPAPDGRHFDRPPAGRGPGGRGPGPGGRAAPVRWDDDLSDPSELAGWRPAAPAGPAPRPAGPPPRPPRVDPDTTDRHYSDPAPTAGTQVLDRGWQDRSPAPGVDDLDEAPVRAGGPARRGRARRPAVEPGPRPELPYVGGFDGLRALALLAILAFHQGFDAARGGFLGISSFLTLSGFLVTTLALAEWSQNGRLALARFWEHRARRIIPALVFTVALVVVLQTTVRAGTGPGFRADVLAALGQVLNWRFAFSGDGFASVLTDPSPVQHLWSLSLLVQLTVLLPLAFVGLMRVTGRRWRLSGALFALAAAGSFAAAWLTADRSGNDGVAYYGTHTRAGELLVGVVLAYAVLSPAVRRVIETPRGVSVMRYGAPVALLGLAWLWHATSIYGRGLFHGTTALNALLTAWVILAVTSPGPLATVLGSQPLRVLGRISYAAYLLHWPIFLVLDDRRLDLPGPALFAVRVAATLAAAALVTYGLERPLRRLRVTGPQLAGALVGSLVVVAAAAMVLPLQPPPGVSLAVDDGSGPGDLDVVAPSGREALSVALVGGTLAGSMPPGFAAWNTGHDEQVRVATHVAADCPLAGAGPVHLAGATVGEDDACVGFAPRLPELLDAADADVVVVVPGVGDLGDRRLDRTWRHLGDPVYDSWLRQRLSDLADTISEHGRQVVWTTALHVRLAPAGQGADWTEVAANDPARVDRLNEIIRSVARDRRDVTLIDLDAWAQQLPRGGEFGTDHRADGRDLTEAGADQAAAWLVPQLLDLAGGTGSTS
jgi:peptidoglycan/LPS O-acetylase OafA/YrhL